ncbi:MAG: 23S rRNA (adenine(2503)-C(2))-methyltransferase RlmN [Phycisphaerales bacterium]|nr:MAG: 23S rRNA (adenine(2503)-C(2))-methyltransferase RlmN [Phycisphaerales bacterium]
MAERPNPSHPASSPPSRLPSPLGLTHAGFVEACRGAGVGSGRADAMYRAFFAGRPEGELEGCSPPEPTRVLESESPEGVVRKFLLPVPPPERLSGRELPEALETESVVIPMRGRHATTHTLCVSSQVGCAMGCGFCETAQMGLIRSLSPAEIVAQWWAATHCLGATIKNIVFMGMGEPLDNPGGVIGAIEALTDRRGAAIAMKNITVSTVGRIDGLLKLRERVVTDGWKRLNLAVSINAPNDEIRDSIMPINRAMPLGELVRVLEEWPLRPSGAICAEYVLIPGVNDKPEHADELAELLKNIRCCVNVIPYNPRRNSPWPAPEEASVDAFLARLEARGQFCKRRRTKGRDTMAACGQLGNEQIRGRKLVQVGLG